MSDNIKTKRFYSTGFIPLSNDESRRKQGLSSQLVTNVCIADNRNILSFIHPINSNSPNNSMLNEVMYPVTQPKVEYNLPIIPKNSSCLRFLTEY
tara:strand:+ start:749 stop:1033 length:285 start_codon:yes stop_codon:yes gene_type:complete